MDYDAKISDEDFTRLLYDYLHADNKAAKDSAYEKLCLLTASLVKAILKTEIRKGCLPSDLFPNSQILLDEMYWDFLGDFSEIPKKLNLPIKYKTFVSYMAKTLRRWYCEYIASHITTEYNDRPISGIKYSYVRDVTAIAIAVAYKEKASIQDILSSEHYLSEIRETFNAPRVRRIHKNSTIREDILLGLRITQPKQYYDAVNPNIARKEKLNLEASQETYTYVERLLTVTRKKLTAEENVILYMCSKRPEYCDYFIEHMTEKECTAYLALEDRDPEELKRENKRIKKLLNQTWEYMNLRTEFNRQVKRA